MASRPERRLGLSTLFWITAVLALAGLGYCIACIAYPPLLNFQYSRMVGPTKVYSDRPIPGEIEGVVRRANTLVAASPLYTPDVLSRPIYLTDGGLRWRLLTLNSKSIALSRPIIESIVINRSSVVNDRVWNGVDAEPARDLSGVIAHERTHVLLRKRFGLVAARMYPTWVVEGYCDFVSGSGSVSDEEAARLLAQGHRTRGLFYYESRKRVEDELARNGGSVEALFSSSRSRQ
jgi:hypothetical protein